MAAKSGVFAAAGQSAKVEGHGADLIVGGTFVGTVRLEVSIPDAAGLDVWVPVGAVLTAPGIVQLAFGMTTRAFRANCTAYTSGSIVYQIVASQIEDTVETA
jgi:hypothetical protein